MLDLASPRWSQLKASPGGNGQLAATSLSRIRGGDDSAYAELQHQACHQYTLGEVAYAVVPHLVDIASNSDIRQRVWPLSVVGAVAAARLIAPTTSPPIPPDLCDAFAAANDSARALTAEALCEVGWEIEESFQLLGAMAAFQGHGHLAMHLFSSGVELSCPVCGEYMKFQEAMLQ